MQAVAPSSGKQRRKFRKILPWLIGAVLLAGIVAGLRPKPLPVEIAVIARGPLTVSVLEEGKTRIRHRFTVSTPVSGYLRRVELRSGDRVEAGGTVLATMQAEPASLLNPRLQSEAEARVKGAEAALQAREADAERARASADLAEKEKGRAVPLRKSGAISTRDWDMAEMESAVRGREARSAEFALQVARFELEQSQAMLMQAQNPQQATGAQLPLLSPVSGFVLNVFEESARILPAGAPIMEVGDPADLEAEIEMLSTDAASIQPGAEALIERWGGPNPLRAVVRVVEPAAFTKISALGVEEQRVKVRVDFTESRSGEQALGDRYRVEARIITWRSNDVLQIPTGALFRRGGDWMCFVAKGGHAQLRQVEIDHSNGLSAEVRSGVAAGETVILHPPDAVVPDAAIRPRE